MVLMVVRVLMAHTVCAPADFRDSSGASAEVDSDNTVGVTDNVQWLCW